MRSGGLFGLPPPLFPTEGSRLHERKEKGRDRSWWGSARRDTFAGFENREAVTFSEPKEKKKKSKKRTMDGMLFGADEAPPAKSSTPKGRFRLF